MQAPPPTPRPSRSFEGRTFLISMSLLGGIAFAQIAVVTTRLWHTSHSPVAAVNSMPNAANPAPAAVAAPTAALARLTMPQPTPLQPQAAATPLSPAVAGSGAPASLAQPTPLSAEQEAAEAEKNLVAELPRPTPVPARAQPAPEAHINDLVNLARALRDRGDTSTALTRLREAQIIAPSNSLIISEMALTYEKMGLLDKAMSQWRRIYEMGEQAGIYYAAAEAKLQALELPPPSSGVATGPAPASAMETPVGGLQPDNTDTTPVLTLGSVGTVDDTGNSMPLRKLKLRVPIVARPGTRVDVHDVIIQVYFYDQLKDGNIVETNANVSSSWVHRSDPKDTNPLPIDWSSPDPEVLEVDYTQVPPEKDSNDPLAKEPRNYFGYGVRVYYKNDLSAVYAEPVKLLKQFPPPVTLQNNDLPQ